MEKTTVKDLVIERLYELYKRNPKSWTMRLDLEKWAGLNRFSGHTVTRRCQELAEDGVIYRHLERRSKRGVQLAFYRYKPSQSIVWKKKEKFT